MTFHLELELADASSLSTYRAGCNVEVWPECNADLVDRMCHMLVVTIANCAVV